MKNMSIKKILVFAVALYLLIASVTYHPDNKLVLNWASQNQGKVWNIWQWGDQHLQTVGQFNYPPLHFYLDKLQYLIAKPIGGNGFYEWLSSPNATDHNQENLIRYSLAIKVPLILFAIFAAYLIFLITKQLKANSKQSLIITALWLFNPIVIYSIAVMGQNDVMAIVFFLFAWYLLNKQKIFLSSVLFGLSASIKLFPLMWLPFLLAVDQRLNFKKRLEIFFYSCLVYIATLLPFLNNPVFRSSVFSNGVDRFFIARIGLGFNDDVLIVPILFMFLVFGLWQHFSKLKKEQSIYNQASILLLFNIIMLFFNHFHPQWFTWLIPFWSIWLTTSSKKNFLVNILLSISALISWVVIILLFNDRALTLGLLTPLNANLAVLPSIQDLLLSRNFSVTLWNNYAHTWLAGLGLIFLINWIKGERLNNYQQLFDFKFNINFKKLNKSIIYLLSLFLAASFILTSNLIANLIPAPLTSSSPLIVDYLPITESLENSFIGDHNGLNRLDLYFSNQELDNRDLFLLTIYNEAREPIWQQEFSGMNVGYRDSIRFNFPLKDQSLDKTYFVRIEPLTMSEKPLLIATTEKKLVNSFALSTQYQKPRSLTYVWESSVKNIQSSWRQMPAFYLILAVLFYLAI